MHRVKYRKDQCLGRTEMHALVPDVSAVDRLISLVMVKVPNRLESRLAVFIPKKQCETKNASEQTV